MQVRCSERAFGYANALKALPPLISQTLRCRFCAAEWRRTQAGRGGGEAAAPGGGPLTPPPTAPPAAPGLTLHSSFAFLLQTHDGFVNIGFEQPIMHHEVSGALVDLATLGGGHRCTPPPRAVFVASTVVCRRSSISPNHHRKPATLQGPHQRFPARPSIRGAAD